MNMCSKFLFKDGIIKFLKVSVMMFHYANKKINIVNVHLRIWIPASFVDHGEESNKDFSSFIFFDHVESELC